MFDLLLVLVERHGHLIDKDQLLQLVWPDTTVEEANLSYTVSILRKTLGEEEVGRLIETVPKRGYRFVAPVRERPRQAISARRDGKRVRWLWLAAVLAVVVSGGLVVWLILSGSQRPDAPLESTPLTAYAGSELYPALSPDGNQVAFSWNGAEEGYLSIYVQQRGGSVPVRLTAGPGNDLSPVWSPDGRTIAFLRLLPDKKSAAIYLVLFPGGPERKLADLQYVRPSLANDSYGAELAWHPNGQWLLVTDRMSPGASPGLCVVSASTGEKRKLLPPPGTPAVDVAAAFRPDGRYLVFIRGANFGSTDVYGVPLSDDVVAQGAPVALSSQRNRRTVSPVWTPDGSDILFLAGPFTGDLSLWRMAVANPGGARRVPLAGDGAAFLSAPRPQGNSNLRLVYSKSLRDENVWRLEEHRPGIASQPAPFLNSTRNDGNAQFSPDGRRIVFQSSRSGAMEIWVCRSDGSNPRQLTSFGGPQIGGPHWAPDSERVVFHARPEGNSDLYLVNASGGPVRRITHEPTQEGTPTWSRDGRWIYFESNRRGPTDIWKMPAEGGAPIQVTTGGGGNVALESLDSKWLYYSKLDRAGLSSLRRIAVPGGEESEVLPSLANMRAFFVVEEGVYFMPAPDAEKRTSIRFLEFSSGKTRVVAPIQKAVGDGISVFPLARGLPRTILYGQLDQDGSDLMLVENLPARR